jgi:hypothetical protein
MAPAAWSRSVDTELAIEIMKEHERADLDIEPGHKPNRAIEPKRDQHEYQDPRPSTFTSSPSGIFGGIPTAAQPREPSPVRSGGGIATANRR